MEHWWNDTKRGKPWDTEKNCSCTQTVFFFFLQVLRFSAVIIIPSVLLVHISFMSR